jgi:hypothetical protein
LILTSPAILVGIFLIFFHLPFISALTLTLFVMSSRALGLVAFTYFFASYFLPRDRVFGFALMTAFLSLKFGLRGSGSVGSQPLDEYIFLGLPFGVLLPYPIFIRVPFLQLSYIHFASIVASLTHPWLAGLPSLLNSDEF